MRNVKPGHLVPVVCVDAGHFGKYNQSPAVPEYYESNMNWKLHLLLNAELEKRGITDTRAYFTEEIRKINARMAPYKAVGHIKLRSEEFVKNTSRKILRFSLDKTVD